MDKARMESFSDGVFAFAITLLVLGFQVPELKTVDDASLRAALLAQIPQLIPYLTSFATIGIIWLNHHSMFHEVVQVERGTLTLNLLLLLVVSFIPYPTAVLGRFGPLRSSAVLYGAVLTLLGLTYTLLWRHIASHKLSKDCNDRQRLRAKTYRNLIGTFGYPTGTLIAFTSPKTAVLIYLALALFYFLPERALPFGSATRGASDIHWKQNSNISRGGSMSNQESLAAEHHEVLDLSRRIRVLMVVANPTTHPVLGWPLGFWAAELTHPWVEFADAGYEVTIASPNGGKVMADGLSDPRDPSKWSADDITSLGFLSSPGCVALLEDTSRLSEVDLSSYDALMVCGGQSPMYTYRNNEDLKKAIREFYESGKITAIFCHGVSALVDVKLSNGKYLAEGKTVTGFANVEEDYSDAFVGQQVMPWRLEDALKERGANYLQGGRFKAFCVRDGNLITGQQQYSGRKVARMVIAALGS